MPNNFSIILTVFLLSLSIPVNATIVEIISVAELAEKSSLIVMGIATNTQSYYTADRTIILTDVHFKVTDKIRGECADEIVIRLEGGTVDKTTTFVLGGPEFSIGEEVLLCVERIKDAKQYRIFGFNQGKFDIRDGKAYRNFKNTTFVASSNLDEERNKAAVGINLNELLFLFKPDK